MSTSEVPGPLVRLVKRWREEAALFAYRGLDREAKWMSSLADDAEDAWVEWLEEKLIVQQAAEESGYSIDHLRSLVRDGTLPDDRPDGSCATIRIPRRYLPRKPGQGRPTTPLQAVQLALEKVNP